MPNLLFTAMAGVAEVLSLLNEKALVNRVGHRTLRRTSGYVYCASEPGKRKLVNGFAFRTPSREWFRMWATPSIESPYIFKDEWIVSHWESGARVTALGVTFRTPSAAMKNAVVFVASLSDEQVNEGLRRWWSGESWPGL